MRACLVPLAALCVLANLPFARAVEPAPADNSAAASAAARSAASPAAPPNFVLIFIDDLGYGDIGPFGASKARTPHLDTFAAEGTKFTSFYATPVCSMSRACLLTGCYSARVSVPGVLFPGSVIGLHPDETTLADLLKQKGYATACVGKWHLGHLPPFLPTKQGFDSYFGIPYSNDMTIDPKHAKFATDCVFREGFTEQSSREKTARNQVPLMRGDEIVEYPADQATLTRRYTEEATRFLRDHKDQPFFLYLPHTMVHHPLAASEAFRGKSASGLLGDAIEELDWSVGEILKTLKQLQLDERTLVIFTSDNGAAAGSSGPLRGKKGSNFEGGVRGPCLARWPGRVPKGAVCDRVAGNIDLLPTFAALSGAALPADRALDGRDITPLLFDPAEAQIRDTHLYFTAQNGLAAIRQGDWKLFLTAASGGKKPAGKQPAKNKPAKESPDGKNAPAAENGKEAALPELYNLESDLAETNNVAADHPEVVERLRALAQARLAEIQKNQRPPGRVPAE